MSGMAGFFTRYIATAVIIINVLYYYFPNTVLEYLSVILYGLAWGAGITGLIINRVYDKAIRQKYNLTKEYQLATDIFGHILPIIVAYYLSPTKTNLTFNQILAIVSIILLVYILLVDPTEQYVGVPLWVMFGVFPLTILLSIYFRFFSATTSAPTPAPAAPTSNR